MSLSREMNDDVRSFDQRCAHRGIANVAVHELMARMRHHILQVLAPPGVCQFIERGDTPVSARLERVADEIAANETGAAGDEDVNHGLELYHPHADASLPLGERLHVNAAYCRRLRRNSRRFQAPRARTTN